MVIKVVDTNPLLDVFAADPAFATRSLAAVRACLADGPLVACEVVWAELYAAFETAAGAGAAWREYRRAGGSRERVIADFLVGAHAMHQTDRLLTRDRGFHRLTFARPGIVDPSAATGSTAVGLVAVTVARPAPGER